jgi:hypothetical protein
MLFSTGQVYRIESGGEHSITLRDLLDKTLKNMAKKVNRQAERKESVQPRNSLQSSLE